MDIGRDISEAQETNRMLEQALRTSMADIDVAYEAARMGMVSSKSVKPTVITLPHSVTVAETPLTVGSQQLAMIAGD